MKKRLILNKHIKKAYTQDIEAQNLDLNMDSPIENIDKLPKEMFQILGEVISFIESTNKFEGDNNENK
jgi:type III secretion system FlhB-like substrate exporter